MRIAITLSLLLLWLSGGANAQNTIEGRVTDKETRRPLESASVTLQQGAEGNIIGYALTDSDGRFRLSSSSSEEENRIITVRYMGYKQVSFPPLFGRTMHIALEQEAVLLKEVQIRPGRVWGRQDTLKYDLTRFASSRDRNVSDVLKKLPGIDVEDNGTIKYNGKQISNLYVEGMDVSGGRYNQINNNLKADAVQTAEVIEGHQPIKSLRGKTLTDDVALNLKLKPEVRSRWIYTAGAGGGDGDGMLYDVSLHALQLSRNRQALYHYKANNTGKDILSDQQELATGNAFDRVTDASLPEFLPLPVPAMPLSQQRLLFNDTHTLSANRLYRLDEDKQLRFRLGYVHDRTTQQEGNKETYYFAQDTLHAVRNQDYRQRMDRMNGELNYEDNTDTHYTREKLSLTAEWKNGLSAITGDKTVSQRISNSRLEVKNYFTRLYTREKYTWGIRSYVRYSYLPASLRLLYPPSGPQEAEKGELPASSVETTENMNVNTALTDNSLYWMRKKNGVNWQLTSGFRGELSSVKNETSYAAHRYMFYTIPRLEWEGNCCSLSASAAMHWSRFPSQSYSSLYVNPSFYFRYKFTPRWKISLSGSVEKTEGGLEDSYPFPYREDYRTVVAHAGIVPETVRRLYSLYVEYKNTVKEFFWTTTMSCLHARHNLMTGRNYTDSIFHLSSAKHPNSTRSYTLNSILSKGVYDWHLKTSLELLLSRNEGKQLDEGVIQEYQYKCLRAEPKIMWAPSSLFEAEYRAVVGCSVSKIGEGTRLDPLWNISQRLTLQCGFHHAEFTLSGEHFYNDLSDTQRLHTWLADASLGYKAGKWRWAVHVNNLFDKKLYSYTLYSAVQSYTSWVKLRSREYRVSVQYQW